MADNVILPGTANTVAADEASDAVLGTAKYQYVKLTGGALGDTTKVLATAAGALSTAESASFEGTSLIELLGQILLELKIANQLLHGLPLALNTVNAANKFDEPAAYRQEPSVFNN